MTDEVFKQSRRKITPEELSQPVSNPFGPIKHMQEAIAKETGREQSPMGDAPFQITGNIPPEFREAMMRQGGGPPQMSPPVPKIQKSRGRADDVEHDAYETFEAPPERPARQPRPTPDSQVRMAGSDSLERAMEKLSHVQWEPFEFPSKGKFYENIPPVVHVRAMTGGEEQILATPRWAKKGKAIDMIFKRCIKEPINTEELLSADRTHLLIFLRGISYTPEYDVEIKCPNCHIKFAHVIPLDDLDVEVCDDDFGPENLSGTLPVSQFRYSYRLPTGNDEQEVSAYRERRIAQWGDQGEDDTLLYRTALLLEEIEGVVMKKELAVLLKKLPVQDVAHLRNQINQPPFGADTEIPMLCPKCSDEFKIDLPLETSFFFPRKKPEKTRA